MVGRLEGVAVEEIAKVVTIYDIFPTALSSHYISLGWIEHTESAHPSANS